MQMVSTVTVDQYQYLCLYPSITFTIYVLRVHACQECTYMFTNVSFDMLATVRQAGWYVGSKKREEYKCTWARCYESNDE